MDESSFYYYCMTIIIQEANPINGTLNITITYPYDVNPLTKQFFELTNS